MKKTKKIIIPLQVIRIENNGVHLLLKIKINNKAARLIVDTGASQTVLDKNRIQRFVKTESFEKNNALSTGLGANNLESHIVKLDKIEFASNSKNRKSIVLENEICMLLDMSHVNYSYSQIGIKEIDGVLGGDFLMRFKSEIDYEKKQMIIKETV